MNSARGPDRAFVLLSNNKATRVAKCKPVIFTPGRNLENGSKRARYEKITCEFAALRDKIDGVSPQKADEICVAVLPQFFVGIKRKKI